MKTLLTILAVCALLASPAWADLMAYTPGDDYAWVAYNNLTATLGQILPAGVTGIAIDEDRPANSVLTGELLDYSTGLGVTIMMETSKPSGYLWVDNTDPQNPGLIFADTVGGSYTGNVIAHNLGTQQLLTFTGLDPNKTYTFAGVATAPSNHHDSLSTVELVGADGAVNESVLTAGGQGDGHNGFTDPLQQFPGFGMTSTSTFISFLDDDLAMWSGIDPGDDGAFSILVTSVQIGYREWAPALDAIVLAEEGAADIPEPATMSLLLVGAIGCLRRRKSSC
jgi:hypothetical protein